MPTLKPNQPLPPIPPNMGLRAHPAFVPIVDIMAAIKRWEAGERPKADHRKCWPGLCDRIDAFVTNAQFFGSASNV